jgi:flagellar L-ring protein precursor FlgH
MSPTLPISRALRLATPLLAGLLLSGCGALQRLSEVGRPPEMTKTADPTKDPNWRPVSMPMPARETASIEANSLWRPGSRAFFKDQRAAQVGDIVTVLVNIADTANVENASAATRSGSETMGVPNLFGLEGALPTMLGKAVSAATLVSASSANGNTGTGTIKRLETVTLRLAGVITQVLPNGNLVVAARQEMRVNSELRELQVSGVIRPQDIASDNTVSHDRMAEARISYGGRGQLTEVQTARYGQQVLDILLPF